MDLLRRIRVKPPKWTAPAPRAWPWKTSVRGTPWTSAKGLVLVISTIHDDRFNGREYFKWGARKEVDETDTWLFSSVYYETLDDAKAAALFHAGVGPKAMDVLLERQPEGLMPDEPRIARRINLD